MFGDTIVSVWGDEEVSVPIQSKGTTIGRGNVVHNASSKQNMLAVIVVAVICV